MIRGGPTPIQNIDGTLNFFERLAAAPSLMYVCVCIQRRGISVSAARTIRPTFTRQFVVGNCETVRCGAGLHGWWLTL